MEGLSGCVEVLRGFIGGDLYTLVKSVGKLNEDAARLLMIDLGEFESREKNDWVLIGGAMLI